MKAYIVVMYRYGDREGHSYPIGVWSKPEDANFYGQYEKIYRGKKYEPVVTEIEIDSDRFIQGIIFTKDMRDENL